MTVVHRKRQELLAIARAALVGLFTAVGLGAMSADPSWLMVAMGALITGLCFVSVEIGVLASIVILSMPVIAAQPVLGFSMLIVLVASVGYLGAGGARGFLVIAVSLVGAFLGPVWAGVALAGYLLGASEGALAAGLACATLEVAGIALGRPVIGATITGGFVAKGHPALLGFGQNPPLLSEAWVTRALTSMNAQSVDAAVRTFLRPGHPMALLVQPFIWALGAALVGAIATEAVRRRSRILGYGGIAVGVAIVAAGCLGLARYQGVDVTRWVGVGAVSSALLALAVASGLDVLFPRGTPTAKVPVRKTTMAAEDADVDELLRLIATAEDKLASQHTSNRFVMITDMKSFSSMTEEDGSVASAKAIQRHRDLLLPIVTSHGGWGKSTGGDGLVASFDSAIDAMLAARDMQRALTAHNSLHPDEREIWIRVGLALGEVVCDRQGRPFIGSGLNLAARVMNLADGGQIFATEPVAASAEEADVPVHSCGEFQLKNIHRPVEIFEVLWREGQEPQGPRDADVVD